MKIIKICSNNEVPSTDVRLEDGWIVNGPYVLMECLDDERNYYWVRMHPKEVPTITSRWHSSVEHAIKSHPVILDDVLLMETWEEVANYLSNY